MKILTVIFLGLLNASSVFAQGKAQDYKKANDQYGLLFHSCSSSWDKSIRSLAEINISSYAKLPQFYTLEDARDFLKKYSAPKFYEAVDKAYNEIIDPSLTDWRERLVIDNSSLGLPKEIRGYCVEVLWIKANINSTSTNDLKLARAKLYSKYSTLSPMTVLFAFLDPELTAYDSEFLNVLAERSRFREYQK